MLSLSVSYMIFNFVMLINNYVLILCCSRNISFRELPIDFPIIHFVMLINIIIIIFVMLRNIYISRETGTPIMMSRAAQNQIVYITQQHEKSLCIFHEQPMIKNYRVSEQHKISMKTPC